MEASLALVCSWTHEDSSNESKLLREWAFQQFAEAKLFEIENLGLQRGLDYLHAMSHIFCENFMNSTLKNEENILELSMQIGLHIPGSLTDKHGLPLAAFLAITHLALSSHRESYNCEKYLGLVNNLSMKSKLQITLPMLIIVCLKNKTAYQKALSNLPQSISFEAPVRANNLLELSGLWSSYRGQTSWMDYSPFANSSSIENSIVSLLSFLISEGDLIRVETLIDNCEFSSEAVSLV